MTDEKDRFSNVSAFPGQETGEKAFKALEETKGETPMFSLYFRNGRRRGVPYQKIEYVDYDPSGGIDILLNDKMTHILVKGRDLEVLRVNSRSMAEKTNARRR